MRKNFSAVLLEMPSVSPISICFDAFGNNLMAAQGTTLKVFSSKNWVPHQVELKTQSAIKKCLFSKKSFLAVTAHEDPNCYCEFSVSAAQ